MREPERRELLERKDRHPLEREPGLAWEPVPRELPEQTDRHRQELALVRELVRALALLGLREQMGPHPLVQELALASERERLAFPHQTNRRPGRPSASQP